jgi:hypothetical protein
MSVPVGTLTSSYRTSLLDFYGRLLGWREIESLRLPDRLTVAVGSSTYISLRERPGHVVSHDYDHFGVFVPTTDELRRVWADLAREEIDLQLEPLSTNEQGEGSFRFRHLLPMAVEVQYYAAAPRARSTT